MSSQSQSAPSGAHPSYLFVYPFRIFFLSLSVLAVLVVPLWVLQITGQLPLSLAIPGLFWHQHELLFGFLSAAIAGFLLTAVCVWTGTERTHGTRLFLLWAVWLAGRLLLAFGEGMPLWLVQVVNLLFMPLVMLDAGWRIWHASQRRQLLILIVLGLFWLMQVGYLTSFAPRYSHGALIMALALIAIIGGRITPAFTNNWLRQNQKTANLRTSARLDLFSVLILIALLAAWLAGFREVAGVIALAAAVTVLVRMAGWQGWKARKEPLLWILHLSILWVPVSLALLAGHLLAGWPANAWAHAAGTGAIGCLILGVMARVCLGHTGRPLTLPAGMTFAFVLVQLAAVLRVVTAMQLLPWQAGLGLSTLLWCLAYGLFLVRYSLILSSPRADGKHE